MPGLAGFSPLRDVDDRFGSKFVSLHNCYAKELRFYLYYLNKVSNTTICSQMTLDVANELDIVLHKGL
jgi:hypothetical protein